MDSIALLINFVNYGFSLTSHSLLGCYNKCMDELKRKYQTEIENLDSDQLKSIAENRDKAMEAARKGIQLVEPEELTPEHIEAIANEMQIIAKMILEERTKN